MSDVKIPEDVMAKAREVHDEIFGPSDYYNVDPIARAILAERERCAGIAEMHDHRGDIAQAIRASKGNKE